MYTLHKGHVPHLARKNRLIRSFGPIDENATISTEIDGTATILPKTRLNRETVYCINPALMCARGARQKIGFSIVFGKITKAC